MLAQSNPWLIVGDFTCIRENIEHIGGQPRALAVMDYFNNCINNCDILGLNHIGGCMPWFNGHVGQTRKWVKLDLALVNLPFLNVFWFAKNLKYMERSTLDHKPLMIQLEVKAISYDPIPFRFQNMWVTHDKFLPLQIWMESAHGEGLLKLAANFKRSKAALKEWNKEVFNKVDINLVVL